MSTDRVNHTLTSPGDQLLYYWLRTPALEEAVYTRRREMIRYMETHPDVRMRIQRILAKTGKHRAAQTIESFAPSAARSGGLWIAILLPILLLISGLCMVKISWMVPVFFALLILLPAYHIGMTRRLETNLPIVNTIVSTIAAYRKIVRTLPDDGAFLTAPYAAAGQRTKAVTRIGGTSFATNNDLMLLVNNFLLFDLIIYELLKKRIGRLNKEVSAIHTCVGELDAAIAAASYRQAAGYWCEPNLSFEADAPLRLRAEGMVHPLLRASGAQYGGHRTLSADHRLQRLGKIHLFKGSRTQRPACTRASPPSCAKHTALRRSTFTARWRSATIFWREKAISLPRSRQSGASAALRSGENACFASSMRCCAAPIRWNASPPPAFCWRIWRSTTACVSRRRMTLSCANCWRSAILCFIFRNGSPLPTSPLIIACTRCRLLQQRNSAARTAGLWEGSHRTGG